MNLFAKSWRGEASLAKAFWLVYFLFSIMIGLIIAFILSLIIPSFTYVTYNNLIMSILFPYTVFSAICVWRCAKNALLIWSILARIVVVLAVISGLFHIYYLIAGPHMGTITSAPPTAPGGPMQKP